jgi:hypothetical protein
MVCVLEHVVDVDLGKEKLEFEIKIWNWIGESGIHCLLTMDVYFPSTSSATRNQVPTRHLPVVRVNRSFND